MFLPVCENVIVWRFEEGLLRETIPIKQSFLHLMDNHKNDAITSIIEKQFHKKKGLISLLMVTFVIILKPSSISNHYSVSHNFIISPT